MMFIPRIKTISNGQYVPFGRTEYAEYATDTMDTVFKLYNENFTVTVNGEDCPVMECRVSAIPFNRPWPGKQRQYEQSESAGYISFYADEAVTLKVKSEKSYSDVKIRPLSKGVETKVVDDEICFTLTEFGSYVLELDGTHNVLHIFYNRIKEYENHEKATHYFGPGIHFPRIINLKDNDTVYIDKEALVFGSIFSEGAKNVRIFGGGILDNSCEERLTESCYADFTKGTFRLYNCENIDVSDIIFVNSSTWVMSMFHCRNITIDNVKIVGHWRYNTDGIDIVNSSDIIVKNSFIRSFDDTISIKAIYDYDKPVENILIDNCVMWCGWSKNCEVGIETCGKEYRNILFKNCDLIHNSYSAISISNGGHARIHDICFENLNIELQNDTALQELQTADSQKYTGHSGHMQTKFVACSNWQYSMRRRNDNLERSCCESVGNTHDIFFKNIRIIAESLDYKPEIQIESVNEMIKCTNFSFENIFINGIKQNNFDNFNTRFINAQNINIK